MASLTDISYIKSLGERYGFSPSKKYGQNFIINPSVCPGIADEAGIDRDTCVIEIGAGIGVLTAELAKRAKKVVSLEIDKNLEPVLKETLSGFDNAEIVFRDVMKTDLASLAEECFGSGAEKIKVRANLPYYITNPVIMKLLDGKFSPESVTVMVQKEAADRLCARPGTRRAGAVSLAVNYRRQAKKCFEVSPSSFYPRPKVTSCVVNFKILNEPPVNPKDPKRMFALIRAGFNSRRKTLPNALASLGYNKNLVVSCLEKAGLNSQSRAENLTLKDFASLSDFLSAADEAL